jgi:hypothetical protein
MSLRTYEPLVGTAYVHDWRLPHQPLVLCSSKAMAFVRPVMRHAGPPAPVCDRGWRAPAWPRLAPTHPQSCNRFNRLSLLSSGGCSCCSIPIGSFKSIPLIKGTRSWRMAFQAPVDAVALAARIRGELPGGSAQHYAAMVILNHLMTYVSTILSRTFSNLVVY